MLLTACGLGTKDPPALTSPLHLTSFLPDEAPPSRKLALLPSLFLGYL